MASKTSPSEPQERGSHVGDFGRRLAARKAELGLSDLLRNKGKNRTASKRGAHSDREGRREVMMRD
jgi:hypothetical protein